ncbi:hypothetical protein SAMN05216312_101563 [Cohnella sp. OV330]|nr:hypothetical protein SAMN05216312_101563 [Cohnella sp. OV330]
MPQTVGIIRGRGLKREAGDRGEAGWQARGRRAWNRRGRPICAVRRQRKAPTAAEGRGVLSHGSTSRFAVASWTKVLSLGSSSRVTVAARREVLSHGSTSRSDVAFWTKMLSLGSKSRSAVASWAKVLSLVSTSRPSSAAKQQCFPRQRMGFTAVATEVFSRGIAQVLRKHGTAAAGIHLNGCILCRTGGESGAGIGRTDKEGAG